ncbi:MAG: hypothetical protein K2Q34_04910 [Alphaproteobacteria bacterium]|nr:hypothetical protein [Alphaproteobacteria bacterium]
MAVIQNLGLLTLVIFILISVYPVQFSSLTQHFTSHTKSQHLLERAPIRLKADGRPLGTVGVIYYTFIKGHNAPLFLLAREAKGNDKGTYSEFGGSLEINSDGSPETFLEGLIRECKEESAHLYSPEPEMLFNSKLFYEMTDKGREVVLCFLKTSNIFRTEDLLDAQQDFEDPHYKEKDAFELVSAKDLLEFVKGKSSSISSVSNKPIQLRPLLVSILKKENCQKTLEQILSEA